MSGLKVIASPLFYALTVYAFWSVSWFNIVVASNKVFAKVFFLQKKSQSFDLPLVTRMLWKMNIDYFIRHFMVRNVVLAISTRKLSPFSNLLVFDQIHMILASMRNPCNSSASPSPVLLSLGLYVDDFVYFSEDPSVEALFKLLLQERVKVDFMGLVEWF